MKRKKVCPNQKTTHAAQKRNRCHFAASKRPGTIPSQKNTGRLSQTAARASRHKPVRNANTASPVGTGGLNCRKRVTRKDSQHARSEQSQNPAKPYHDLLHKAGAANSSLWLPLLEKGE